MDLRLFFRKLFSIPNREFKYLYRKYSSAEKELDSHINGIKPYNPITGKVKYPVINAPKAQPNVALYTPSTKTAKANSIEAREDRITKMGMTVEAYDSFLLLCQRAEKAFNDGEHSTARAIMDSLEEMHLPNKPKALQDYEKRLRTKIK